MRLPEMPSMPSMPEMPKMPGQRDQGDLTPWIVGGVVVVGLLVMWSKK